MVFLGQRADGGVDRPDPGYPGGPKMEGGGGLDAELYKDLRADILERRLVAEDSKDNLRQGKRATYRS